MRLQNFSIALLAALTLTCGGRSERADATRFPNAPVIIISIDTLRADHLPAYGYKAVETPAIDAFRRDAILYRNAYSHVPMTLPSHVSLLTGLLPQVNQVRNNLGYPYDAAKYPAIPSLLKPAGYSTGAAISAYVIRGATGLANSFDFYDDSMNTRGNVSVGELSRAGAATEKVAARWIGERGNAPFFFFLHLFEPHTPYEPVEPFKSRFPSAYDGEIATADQVVGEFLDALKKQGVYDRAVIVLLSDHGEGLGDHGEQEHGIFLYREALHVPLLLKLPRSQRGGETIDRVVQLIDVAPTLLGAVGVAPPQGLTGRSLLEPAPDTTSRRIYSETLLPRVHFGWSELRSLTDERHQYIEAPRPELYDYVADPRETRNVLNDERRVYAQMRDAMAPLRTATAAPANVDSEEAAKLAALGYIGNVRTDGETGALPDPKDRIADLERMKLATQFEHRHDYAAAVQIYEALLRENGQFADAWLKLAEVREQLGDVRGAIEAYRRGVTAAPQLAPGVALSIGELHLKLGELAEAEAHASAALKRSPGGAHLLLARVALARRDAATAEREARLAMQDQVRARDASVLLAQVWSAAGRYDNAISLLDEVRNSTAAAGLRPVENLESTRGDVLARMGRNADAEAAFADEIRSFPANRDAYIRLAVLYASQGRTEEARKTLNQMVSANPDRRSMNSAAATFAAIDMPEDAARWRRTAASR